MYISSDLKACQAFIQFFINYELNSTNIGMRFLVLKFVATNSESMYIGGGFVLTVLNELLYLRFIYIIVYFFFILANPFLVHVFFNVYCAV
jgi:hypothetical protein